MTLRAFVATDNVLEVGGLLNGVTAAYANAATVAVTLTNADTGAQVAGATWPLALAYTSASNGVYTVTLPDTLSLVDGQRYLATITADAGAGLYKTWVLGVYAEYDRS